MSKKLTNNNLLWAGVDFDGVICENSGYPKYRPLRPIKGTKQALEAIEKKGLKIIIFTARSWTDHQLIEDFMNKYKLPFRRIICGKPLLRFMIDDRNIEFGKEGWKKALTSIV